MPELTIQETLYPVLWVLVFPGFLFTGIVGLVITWIDRKVTARVQYRVGPPWWQPFADITKLLGKETILPRGASRLAFLGSPLVAVAGASLVSTMLWVTLIGWHEGFVGDVFVIVYLLVLPSLAIILGGAAARSPLAAVGASREMKLVLAYELPFVIALAAIILKADGAIRLDGILAAQVARPFIASVSGILVLVVLVMVIQAKLGLVPFDQAEAETELMGGALIEYSGAPLAAFKLAKAMLYFALPVLGAMLLVGGVFDFGDGMKIAYARIAGLAGLALAFIVLAVVIRNTNPRVRIEVAMRFFWGPVTALAVLAVAAAAAGRAYGIPWL
ncbi:MAG: respiratory chain complex I subunit 1 family protein [Planctomycetota bacterium]|jgi:NADH-quinone oxidoreductase subunit H